MDNLHSISSLATETDRLHNLNNCELPVANRPELMCEQSIDAVHAVPIITTCESELVWLNVDTAASTIAFSLTAFN